MKYIDAELIKSTKGLYNDIDSCIDELLKARVGHNQENEGKALFRMEGLMVATLQQLDCIIDSLQQEQPEVDLEKDIESWFFNEISSKINVEHTMYHYFQECARRYFELGRLNAEKEESK